MTRAVFSDAARVAFEEADVPMIAFDAATGCSLSYRFEAHAGGILRITDGPIGRSVLAIVCELGQLDLVASLLLNGMTPRQ